MNISIDERTKHRLTGLVVLLAIAIIFVPAMIKKSNQRLEENIHVSVQLPPKPSAPKVAVLDQQTVFETVKVAEVTLPEIKKPSHVSQIARAEGLKLKAPEKKPAPVLVKPVVAKAVTAKPIAVKPVLAKARPKSPEIHKPQAIKPVPVNTAVSQAYAVQLASFGVQRNAEKLVSRLRGQGYKARYHIITSGDHAFYKVTVGQLDDRDDAHALKEKLSDSMKLHGFVVKQRMG